MNLFQYFSSQGDFQVIEEGTWQGLETPHINCDQVKQISHKGAIPAWPAKATFICTYLAPNIKMWM